MHGKSICACSQLMYNFYLILYQLYDKHYLNFEDKTIVGTPGVQ